MATQAGLGISRTFDIAGTSTPFYHPNWSSTGLPGYVMDIGNSTSTLVGNSVSQGALAITPVINQTGTAAYTALLVNAIETATGSGAKLLQDWQVSGTSVAKIDNTGAMSIGRSTDASARLTLIGGNNGSALITLSRPAASAQFSWALAGAGLSFSDDMAGAIVANMYGNGGANEVYVGQKNRITTDTRTSILGAQTYNSGSNVPGQTFFIRGGAGTGSAAVPGIQFQTADVTTSGATQQNFTTKMTITGSGSVGIGTTSPSAQLEVSGTIKTLGSTTPVTINPSTIVINSVTQMGPNGFTSSAGYTGGYGYDATPSSLTSGGIYRGTSSSNSFTGRLLNLVYSGTNNGTVGYFQISNASATGNVLDARNSGSGHLAVFTGTGNVGIGTSTPTSRLHVVSATAGTTVATFSDGSATCNITPATTGSVTCSSDLRLKKDIEKISETALLDQILKLETVHYKWKNDSEKIHTGYIAQDLERIIPELVVTDSKGYKQISYAGLVPVITGAIKALKAENQKLKNNIIKNNNNEEITNLKRQVDLLTQQNASIKEYLCAEKPKLKICQK